MNDGDLKLRKLDTHGSELGETKAMPKEAYVQARSTRRRKFDCAYAEQSVRMGKDEAHLVRCLDVSLGKCEYEESGELVQLRPRPPDSSRYSVLDVIGKFRIACERRPSSAVQIPRSQSRNESASARRTENEVSTKVIVSLLDT